MTDSSPAPGFFLSVEGGDHAGKSTLVGGIVAWAAAHVDCEVVRTREPGGTALGAQLRQLILHGDDVAPRAEALLYAADRAHHVATVVRPALERGALVITDRYLDSSVAYQAAGRQLSAVDVENISLWATEGLMPQATILLDLDPAVAVLRRQGDADRLEASGMDFHRRTRDAFLRRAGAEPQRWTVIDAAGSPAQILASAVAALGPRLLAWRGDGAGQR